MCANLCTRDHPCHAIPSHPIELRPSRSHARTSRPCHAIRSGTVFHMRWRQMHSTVRASHPYGAQCTAHSACEATADRCWCMSVESARIVDAMRIAMIRIGTTCALREVTETVTQSIRCMPRGCMCEHACVRLCVRVHALACAFARVPQHTAPILASRLSRLSRPSWPRCNSADAAGCTRGSPQRNTECVRRSHAVAIAADSTTAVKPTRKQGKETRNRTVYGSNSVDRPQ